MTIETSSAGLECLYGVFGPARGHIRSAGTHPTSAVYLVSYTSYYGNMDVETSSERVDTRGVVIWKSRSSSGSWLARDMLVPLGHGL